MLKKITAALLSLICLRAPMAGAAEQNPEQFYNIAVETIEGGEETLAAYRGKALLIVNTASKCGFTSQYAGLQDLQKKYGDKGFTVLGFPSNDFMGQEPGTNEEIAQFCEVRFGVQFPMFSKIKVKGDEAHPLYQYLTSTAPDPGPISWNFNKFLITPDGVIHRRYGSRVAPDDESLIQDIESVLPQS